MNKAEQIEEAIEVLGLQVKALNDELKTLEFEEDKEAYEFDISIKSLAIEALQQSLEREKNEPLTLEQLEDMDGKPVWIQCEIIGFEDTYGWCIVERIRNECLVEITIEGEYSNINYTQYTFYKYKKESD